MANLSATTIYGKLKTVGSAVINGTLTVKNGIEVDGGVIDTNGNQIQNNSGSNVDIDDNLRVDGELTENSSL